MNHFLSPFLLSPSELLTMMNAIVTVGYSTLLLTISIPPTFDPSLLSFPTPLFPSLDPRTSKPGTQGLVLQLWKIHVTSYTDEAVKGAGQKGWYGFVRPSPFPLSHFPLSKAEDDLGFVVRLIRQLLYTHNKQLSFLYLQLH